MQGAELILASASPRRQMLLRQLDLHFKVIPANVDETPQTNETPYDYVRRVANAKAELVSNLNASAFVVSADTSVVIDETILGKPGHDERLSAEMLRRLSDRSHQVLTAVSVIGPGACHETIVKTEVQFRALSDEEIHWYVKSQEGVDKAGGYAIQGKAGMFIARIEGSHSNVVGLPLSETLSLLQRAGFPLPWSHRP